MKIRIKIKHLVLGVVSVILLFIVLHNISPRIELMIAQKQLEQGNLESKAKILSLIHNTKSNKHKWKLIEKYVIEPKETELIHRFDVFISPGFTMASGDIDGKIHFTQDEGMQLLRQYVQGAPAGRFLMFAAVQLSDYYAMDGDLQAAADLLEMVIQKFENDIHNGLNSDRAISSYLYELKLELASTNDGLDQPERAAQQYEYLADAPYGDRDDIIGKAALYHSEMLLRRGSPHAAKEVLNQLSEGSNRRNKNSEVTSRINQLNNRLQSILDRELLSTVSGTVQSSEGEPMPFVGIMLRKKIDQYHSPLRSEPYQMLTDAKGQYRFESVEAGSYQLAIGLNYEQIDGRTWSIDAGDWVEVARGSQQSIDVTMQPLIQLRTPVNNEEIRDDTIYFEWDSFPEAAYYKVNIGMQLQDGGKIMTSIANYIEGNSLRVSVQDLYDQRVGISYEDRNEWTTVDPGGVLGFANPAGFFFWSVDAYREDGTRLTSSSGYRLNEQTIDSLPYFLLKEREETPEDRLVLDRKYDEALEGYTRKVKLNPGDVHSLRMKLRMLQLKDMLAEDIASKGSKETLIALEAMIGQRPAPTYLWELADYFYNHEEWDEYNQAFDRYLSIRGDHEDRSYTDSLHATALMKQGKYRESETWFEQSIPLDPSHRFIGNYLAAHLLGKGTLESVLRLAEKYPDRMNSTDWAVLVKRMLIESKGEPDFTEILKDKLKWIVDGDETAIQRWEPEQGYKEIKPFLRALLDVD
ncbi:hypothetical protein AM231_13765 [Paenibacillus solani]|uniref:Carboxypeptidase regulatory-like domain-containing protein n=1 Tax=Paenibacillus solani TaxID=1705565 RepID=A0A0M1P6I8_9BACL|nr:hypothetical protein AM231_13765 [Paenibacillus solani]